MLVHLFFSSATGNVAMVVKFQRKSPIWAPQVVFIEQSGSNTSTDELCRSK